MPLPPLLLLLLLAAGTADGKGGGFGFGGGGRVRTSSAGTRATGSRGGRASSAARPSTNPYYRGHPEPSRPCVGCYYGGASGLYYDRTFMYMYLGMAYSCMGCGRRSDADVDSLEMSLPAVTATAAVNINSLWYADDVLTVGSSDFTAWAAELSEVVSSLADGAVAPASCLVTALTPRAGFAEGKEQDGELHVDVSVTIMLEAEDADAASVVGALQKNCAGTTPGSEQLGHWELPHCLTGVAASSVVLTSVLDEDAPIPPAQSSDGGGSGFGDLLLAMLLLGVGVWCCASCAERRAEALMMGEPPSASHRRHRTRGSSEYGQLRESDHSDEDDEGSAGAPSSERSKMLRDVTGSVVAVEAQPVVQAVAVPASDAGVSGAKGKENGAATVSTGFQ